MSTLPTSAPVFTARVTRPRPGVWLAVTGGPAVAAGSTWGLAGSRAQAVRIALHHATGH